MVKSSDVAYPNYSITENDNVFNVIRENSSRNEDRDVVWSCETREEAIQEIANLTSADVEIRRNFYEREL